MYLSKFLFSLNKYLIKYFLIFNLCSDYFYNNNYVLSDVITFYPIKSPKLISIPSLFMITDVKLFAYDYPMPYYLHYSNNTHTTIYTFVRHKETCQTLLYFLSTVENHYHLIYDNIISFDQGNDSFNGGVYEIMPNKRIWMFDSDLFINYVNENKWFILDQSDKISYYQCKLLYFSNKLEKPRYCISISSKFNYKYNHTLNTLEWNDLKKKPCYVYRYYDESFYYIYNDLQ